MVARSLVTAQLAASGWAAHSAKPAPPIPAHSLPPILSRAISSAQSLGPSGVTLGVLGMALGLG
eukprot:scaffold1908_cov104-Isochrysis_galbana.AAC.7